MDPKTPRHVIIKMPKVKDKERIVKATREKLLLTYRGVSIRLISQKKLCRLEGIGKKYSVMKRRDTQPRLLYPVKLSFRIKG